MLVFCPYCSSTKTLAIVFNDSIAPKSSTYKEMCNQSKLKRKEAILSNWNVHYSKDYDGKIVKRRTYDRYCIDCKKPFYYISNLLVSDIKTITFIVEMGNDRWKYEIYFDEDNSYYNIDHNYFTKEQQSVLTPARRRKILEGIDKSKCLYWKPLVKNDYFNYNIKWNVYITFSNEQVYCRGGLDEYPNDWEIFIEFFIKVFKNEILKKMKKI